MSTFGPEFEKIWPTAAAGLKLTEFGKKLLKKCETVEKPDAGQIDLKEFLKKSSNFPLEFGTNTCRVMSQPKDRYPNITQQIASAYPVIHERVLGLYLAFLEHKCEYGGQPKYYKRLSLTDFVNRLLRKRCVSFTDHEDNFLLLSGEEGHGGFTKVGTLTEKPPLLFANVLSYEEMKLSAFLSVSSHSEFLNDGNRDNGGKLLDDKSSIVPEGVVVGLIGGRFQREGFMEWQDIMISREQNTKENGYGPRNPETKRMILRSEEYRRLWTEFYEEKNFLYETALAQCEEPRFYELPYEDCIFDNVAMKKRYAISFDTLLLDAEARGAAKGQQVFVHAVGMGLGVWRIVSHQEQIYLETFAQRLKWLLPKLPHISVVHFSWFGLREWGDLKDGGILKSETHPDGGIRTFISNRNPAQKLPVEFNDMLVVVSYAWDSNALPGNEFWLKFLGNSSDSSTASSTLITELHNPHINEEMVNGKNLHIASAEHGVMHIADYARMVLE